MGVIPSDSERSLGFPLWSVSLYWYLISYWIGWSSFPIKVEHLVGVMGLNQWMTNSFIGTKSRLPHIISAVQCSLVRWCVEVLQYYREVFKRDELLDVRYGWCSRRSVDDKVKHRIYSYSPLYLRYNPSLLSISQQHKSHKIIYCLLVEYSSCILYASRTTPPTDSSSLNHLRHAIRYRNSCYAHNIEWLHLHHGA